MFIVVSRWFIDRFGAPDLKEAKPLLDVAMESGNGYPRLNGRRPESAGIPITAEL